MPRAVHQFSQYCGVGDGVTNGAFFTRRLLRELGFESEIYSDDAQAALAGEVLPLEALERDADSWLLVHHALGYPHDGWLADFAGRIVLVYHNITPIEQLPADGPWRELARLGHRQLSDWRPWIAGAIGVSEFNAAGLREAGYAHARALPLLVDVQAIQCAPWDDSVPARYEDTTNILFVGRLAPNKRHDLLLDAFAEFLHYADGPARLILAGAPLGQALLPELRARAASLGIAAQVDFLGHVPDTVLRGLYRAADLFVCTSDHEGFGMPLIEAGVFDVPVIARATSNVADTLGEGGLLLSGEDPREIGVLMHMVLTEPALRRRILAGQQANLARFEPQRLRTDLAACLASLGLHAPEPRAALRPTPTPTPTTAARWVVEGPFDSSYSLAIVNRETARALTGQGVPTALAVTPGAGEPPPDEAFLAANPDVAAMAAAARRPGRTDVTLRFTHPPHTVAMAGRVRVLHGYGWEESGFPARYVRWFNRRLDLVTALSTEVAKILRDAGVRVPIAVVGAGVDQWPAGAEIASPLPENASRPTDIAAPRKGVEPPRALGKGYRFLHVSSCFPRKGVDVLLSAYGKAFRASDDVTLVIKTFPNPHNDASKQLAALRRQDPDYPDVVLIEEDWPQHAMTALYRRCQAFVAPSRGEGFGLPMAEAMRFGLPVITTGWGGQTDFCDADTAWLVDYEFAPARTHLEVEHSVWAEPDRDHLARLMSTVRRASPEELAPRVAAARARVNAECTWDRVAAKTRAAVAALDRMPQLRAEPRVGWVSSWNSRCGIAAYSASLAQAIPADRLQVFASRATELVAQDAANVTRCWDSGVFDPPGGAAAGTDELVEALERAAIDTVVIQYNFGFFGTDRLARLVDRSKARGRAVHLFLHATQDVDNPDFKASLGGIVPSLARVDRIHVHGVDDLNRLRRLGLVRNVVLWPHGVPTLAAEPASTDRLAGRRVIASYGFLLPHKGIVQLVEAFAALRPAENDLHLLLACALYSEPASGPVRDEVAALVRRHGLDDRVTLITDYLSDQRSLAWLQRAELIVYPYQHTQESSSAAVRMGLASGRPVAVTPLGIFDDVGDTVHRLPGTNPEQLAAGIARLLGERELLFSRQPAAARYVTARAWPALARRLLDMIDGAANPLPLAG